jgi:hypothetical protein
VVDAPVEVSQRVVCGSCYGMPEPSSSRERKIVMARVFISYSRRDAEVADRVRGWLEDAGHEVFLDRDIDYGIRIGRSGCTSGCAGQTP